MSWEDVGASTVKLALATIHSNNQMIVLPLSSETTNSIWPLKIPFVVRLSIMYIVISFGILRFCSHLSHLSTDDYVTEKFFTRMKKTVTVVLGQANYTRLAPPHSYINVLDYPSPQALASYLLSLHRNPQAYLSYFWWQDYYQVRPESVGKQARATNFAQAMCRLCERLHTDNNSRKVYDNMQDWWKNKSHCGANKAPMGNETDGRYSVSFGTGGG